MSIILNELAIRGCDVEKTMKRMSGDEEFYVECLWNVVDDPSFEKLQEALVSGNTSAAFDAAHTLKGLFANVGLTPMYNIIVEIVEPLRAGSNENLIEKYAQLLTMREGLRTILKN